MRLAGIINDSIVDGPGIRTVFFMQGCLRHCPGCHNPQTWDMEGGKEFGVSELLAIVESNPLCHGVTLSGGEPFLQARELIPFVKALKERGYEVASYTGFLYEDLLNGTEATRELLGYLDVLIDGPFIESEKSLELNFRGSRNQRVINVPESLKARKVVLEESERWTG